jgi:hypothetical protein
MLDAGKHQQQQKKLLLCRPASQFVLALHCTLYVHTMYVVTCLYVHALYSTPVNCINNTPCTHVDRGRAPTDYVQCIRYLRCNKLMI